MVKDVFKGAIVIFTKSVSNTLLELEKKPIGTTIYHDIIDDDGLSRIQTLIDHQINKKESGEKMGQSLIIFDEFITDSMVDKKRGEFNILYTMGRHYGISVMTTSQVYNLVPLAIRKLAHYYMIFKPTNLFRK
jgi:hypothetical protein